MIRILSVVGAILGGWAGWFIGMPLGAFGAFMTSAVASGLGMYFAAKWARKTFD